ncbi:Tail tube protein [uncultured Gammaproteobacteria bacterium]
MALTAIGLCGRALIKIGATAIGGFDDGTAEAEVAGALYGPTRDALLSAQSWSFATTQATLPRLAEAPLADYACAFQLPADFLRALSAGLAGRGRGLDYRLTGRTLQADADSVVLTYIFRPPEEDFPAFFDQVLIARLAAEFCIPLTESTSRADSLYKLAENEFRRARLIDGQQDVRPGFEDFSLISARF